MLRVFCVMNIYFQCLLITAFFIMKNSKNYCFRDAGNLSRECSRNILSASLVF